MKFFKLVLILILAAQVGKSQTLSCRIKGILLHDNQYKYAYLQASKKAAPLMTTIANNAFEFTTQKNGDFDLRTLYLAIDSIDRKEFVAEQKTFRVRSSRLIAMENLTIEIDNDLPHAVVIGGADNIEVDEMAQVLVSKEYLTFFKKHSNSRISLLLLQSLITYNKIVSNSDNECLQYYGLLTERLKNTPEAQKIHLELSN